MMKTDITDTVTVTMKNKYNGCIVTGIDVSFIPRWNKLGFEVIRFDTNKVVMFKAS